MVHTTGVAGPDTAGPASATTPGVTPLDLKLAELREVHQRSEGAAVRAVDGISCGAPQILGREANQA